MTKEETREITLSTGRKVTLRENVTFKERMSASNRATTGLNKDGEAVMLNTFNAQMLWVKYGLVGIDDGHWQTIEEDDRIYPSDKTLDRLSNRELSEIGRHVRIRAEEGDYAKKEDKKDKVNGST